MYNPIQSEYSFSGYYRTLGVVVIILGSLLTIVAISFDLSHYYWPLTFIGVLLVVMSYLPSVTWCNTEIRLRTNPFAKARSIPFTSIYTIMVTLEFIKIRSKEIKEPVTVKLAWFSKQEQRNVLSQFRQLEEELKASVLSDSLNASKSNDYTQRARDPLDAYFTENE